MGDTFTYRLEKHPAIMTEEKKTFQDERRYAIITKDSIKLMADSAGHADTSDVVAGILGEDVSYRLREITQKSAQFMRHAKRRRMNTEDFNKACRHSDIQPVHGHGSVDPPLPFRQTKEGEIHFVEDPEVNLATVAFNGYMPKQLGETTIKAHWLAVEGIQKTPQTTQGAAPNLKPEPNATLMKYFNKITQAIVGSDAEMIKTALTDLRTNSNLSPLLPHLISFISNGVKTVNHDLRKLTKLLYMAQSLVYNGSLFLEPQPYLAMLIQSVQQCLLEPVPYSTDDRGDQWTVRDYAARLLAHIVSIWGNGVNHLERFTEKTLRETLYDHKKPFCSHYGAVMGLLYLGSESIERVVLPHLSAYWPHLQTGMEFHGLSTVRQQEDAHKVYGALLLSVEYVMRKYIKEFKEAYIPEDPKTPIQMPCIGTGFKGKSAMSTTRGFISMFDKAPAAFFREMAEYFGDSLTARLPEILELKCIVFQPAEKDLTMSLADPESSKTGEELLNELMEQVKQEEITRKEKEKKKFVPIKQEREINDREERRRLEHERRIADHKQQLQMALLKKQKQAAADSDDEIDVEGDNDKSDNSFQSDKSEEDGQSSVSLAIKSTVSSPGQGIKMTITKRPKLTLSLANFSDSPLSDTSETREKDVKQSRKRKHSQTIHNPGQFDFEDISDYEAAPTVYGGLSEYLSEGEGSSDGGSGRKSLTMKFRKRDTFLE